MQATLATESLEPSDVIKTTVYLQNIDDFDAMNQVYAEFFTDKLPVRSTVQVAGLPKIAKNGQLLVEIEAVAVRRGK